MKKKHYFVKLYMRRTWMTPFEVSSRNLKFDEVEDIERRGNEVYVRLKSSDTKCEASLTLSLDAIERLK